MAAFRNVLRFPLRNVNSITGVSKTSAKFSTTTCRRSAYEADGKTTVSVMNNDSDAPLMINSYSVLGFRLNNGCFVIGPIAIFPHSILSWNIKNDYDINEKSLSLFLRLHPKLDVLVIGIGDAKNPKLLADIRTSVKDMVRELKQGERFNVEVLTTEKAVTTFNFLNAEKRFVAAALVPPLTYTATLDDEFRMDYLAKKKGKLELLF